MERILEACLFASRWLLTPLYIALLLILFAFIGRASMEVWHLFATLNTISDADLMLGTLSLIDLILVANLLVMVTLSSYETFVSRLDIAHGEDRPPWLGKLDASMVKLKLSIAIVAISAIHLLKVFLNISKYTNDQIFWMVTIHATFVISCLLLSVVDRIAFAEHRNNH